ncbi:MAG: carbamoyl-phosphate synthase large subunit, partial [bacterium]
GVFGLTGNKHLEFNDFEKELRNPTDERVFAVVQALEAGYSVESVHKLTNIDKWFLYKISHIIEIEKNLRVYENGICPRGILLEAKQAGFSDQQISMILGCAEGEVRSMRKNYGLRPCVKQIDTLAAEYPAKTNYLYLTYNGVGDDIQFPNPNSVIVLGSGVYRIGSSVEFDWCCVNAVSALRKMGYQTILINCNPETVSTDFDECDRLFFDELSFETIFEIYENERPLGVVISMGGQIPNNLAVKFSHNGLTILGTTAENIDRAEDRHKFSSLLDKLGIDQPAWKELVSLDEAKKFAEAVQYPVLVRPSYVLSGAAMGVASTDKELTNFLEKAVEISSECPIVISKFLEDAKEIEFDAVASNGEVIVSAISEHVENAGVHSGDATLVLPPQRTYIETMRKIRNISAKIAHALQITGPFNIQFIAKDNDVKVIECNLRASRSFPFVSKVCKVNFIEIATKALMEEPVDGSNHSFIELDYVGVKAPQFSFTRLQGADPTLGVEMASTGEVGCLGDDFEEAFLKAMIAVGFKFPLKKILISTGPLESKAEFVSGAKLLRGMGVQIFATRGTSKFMGQYGVETEIVNWPLEKKSPNVLQLLSDRGVDLVINIPKNFQEEELTNDYIIRRKAVDFGIPLIT